MRDLSLSAGTGPEYKIRESLWLLVTQLRMLFPLAVTYSLWLSGFPLRKLLSGIDASIFTEKVSLKSFTCRKSFRLWRTL